jgi:glutathione S-transferase
VPYVTLDDGKVLGDSNLIIEELKKRYGDPLDEKLTDRQKAMALALQSLIEDKLYFAAAYLRWAETDSWNHVREVLLKFMPPVIGGMILKKIRKGFLKDLGTHGIADFSREEIVKLSTDSLTALSVLLGDQDFFLGSEPSSVDAAMYGFLIQQIWIPWDSPVKQHALGLKNLVSFCERMKARYWEPSSKI